MCPGPSRRRPQSEPRRSGSFHGRSSSFETPRRSQTEIRTIVIPASGTEATIAPLRLQIEQAQRRGSTIPFDKSNSSITAPQRQDARCFALILVPPTSFIMFTSKARAEKDQRQLLADCCQLYARSKWPQPKADVDLGPKIRWLTPETTPRTSCDKQLRQAGFPTSALPLLRSPS